jgi:all-trans-retinol 13,14-reductase
LRADVVIVGSGISGLTAASILAKKGKKVKVLEARTRPGGALRKFERGGICYDVGFHYTGCLGRGEILRLLWDYCDVYDKLDVSALDGKSCDRYEFHEDHQGVDAYFSYDRFTEELIARFPRERSGIERYFREIRKICRNVPFYDATLPLTPFLRGYKDRPASLSDFLADITDNSYLRSVLAAPGFLYGTPTSQASVEVHALVAHGYYSGAYTISGGGQAIVDAFVSELTSRGVEFYTGSAARSVSVSGGKVAGILTSEDEYIDCDQVIYTGHPAGLIGVLPENVFRPAYRKRLLNLKNSLSMYAVFGRSEKTFSTRQGPLNYFVIQGTREVLPARAATLNDIRPMMMTGTRSTPEEILQGGGNGIILLRLGYWKDVEKYTENGGHSRTGQYDSFKDAVAAEMIRTAEKRWGDIVGSIHPVAVGTPLTFRDELQAPQGGAYGAMHCLDQFNPEVRTRLPGLFLAGQSTLMTGVAGASISGLVAAGEATGLESLWEEITRCS